VKGERGGKEEEELSLEELVRLVRKGGRQEGGKQELGHPRNSTLTSSTGDLLKKKIRRFVGGLNELLIRRIDAKEIKGRDDGGGNQSMEEGRYK